MQSHFSLISISCYPQKQHANQFERKNIQTSRLSRILFAMPCHATSSRFGSGIKYEYLSREMYLSVYEKQIPSSFSLTLSLFTLHWHTNVCAYTRVRVGIKGTLVQTN